MTNKDVKHMDQVVIQEDESSTNDSDQEYDPPMSLRAKWCLDGANTLDDCVDKLKEFIEYIQILKDDGWELIDSINDDWGFLRQHQKQNQKTSDETSKETTKN